METKPNTPARPSPRQSFEPWVYKDRGMRPAMIEHLKTFKPAGDADPVQLESIRTFAIAEINALPEEANFVTVNIEAASNSRARQSNVIVLPESVRS